jgi:hypothetical protein
VNWPIDRRPGNVGQGERLNECMLQLIVFLLTDSGRWAQPLCVERLQDREIATAPTRL